MKLRNQGVIQAAPILHGHAEKVSSAIQQWVGMKAFTHWKLGDPTTIDGAEFHVDDEELGHIHLDGEIHLRLTQRLRNALLETRLAQPFPWAREWVEMSVQSEEGVDHALWLSSDWLRSAQEYGGGRIIDQD